MKRKIIGTLAVLLVIILTTACVGDSESDQVNVTETYCEGTSEIINQPVTGMADLPYYSQSSGTFVVTPPPGCELPTMYCVYIDGGYDGGLSCTPISE